MYDEAEKKLAPLVAQFKNLSGEEVDYLIWELSRIGGVLIPNSYRWEHAQEMGLDFKDEDEWDEFVHWVNRDCVLAGDCSDTVRELAAQFKDDRA